MDIDCFKFLWCYFPSPLPGQHLLDISFINDTENGIRLCTKEQIIGLRDFLMDIYPPNTLQQVRDILDGKT